MRSHVLGLFVLLGCVACGSTDDDASGAAPSDDERQTQIRDDVRHSAFEDIQLLVQSADELCIQAPKLSYDGPGWDAVEHAAAIDGMKVSWRWARSGYERSKGVLSPQFPDTVAQLDARYEDHSEPASYNLFSGQSWGGLHAFERILWADQIPTRVVEFESALPGYVAASWPTTGMDAFEFERTMCGELIDDLGVLESQWAITTLQVDAVFLELVSLMSEPREQLVKSVSGADESRYSQRTLADLRDTLIGTRKTYPPFRDYLRQKPNGSKVDAKILAGFEELSSAYQEVPGDTFPSAPATWSSENPSAADLATPFGKLYQAVDAAADPDDDQSLVTQMTLAADLLGFESTE